MWRLWRRAHSRFRSNKECGFICCKKKTLTDKIFLITSGPTREYIDRIRFISNPSSGKTGYFLAKEAKKRGAQVIYITGKSQYIPDADIIEHVQSAEEMLKHVKKYYREADVIIGAAAVGDFTPVISFKDKKIERKKTLNLKLKPTKDILGEIGKNKGKRILVGFAAETEKSLKRAKQKIKEKNLDLIIYNNISKNDIGFDSDINEIKILDKNSKILFSGRNKKEELASVILDKIEKLL